MRVLCPPFFVILLYQPRENFIIRIFVILLLATNFLLIKSIRIELKVFCIIRVEEGQTLHRILLGKFYGGVNSVKFNVILSLGSILRTAFYGAETLAVWKVDQKYLDSFEMWWCRRMEKISWTDRVRNEVLHRDKEDRNTLHTIERRKAIRIGHILCRNCLLNHIIKGR